MTTYRKIAGLALVVTLGLSGCTKTAPRAATSLQEVPAEQLFQKAQQLKAQGDFVGAEQYLQAAVASGYDEGKSVQELVRVCLASDRFASALSYAEPYLLRHPENWGLRHVVATVYHATGDAGHALRELSQVVMDAPEFAPAHFLKGVILRDAFYDETGAESAFRTYLSLSPSGDYAAEVKAYLRGREAMKRLSSNVTTEQAL